jgi:hypothetical protein
MVCLATSYFSTLNTQTHLTRFEATDAKPIRTFIWGWTWIGNKYIYETSACVVGPLFHKGKYSDLFPLQNKQDLIFWYMLKITWYILPFLLFKSILYHKASRHTVSNVFFQNQQKHRIISFSYFSTFQNKNEVQTYNQLLSIQIEIRISFH